MLIDGMLGMVMCGEPARILRIVVVVMVLAKVMTNLEDGLTVVDG